MVTPSKLISLLRWKMRGLWWGFVLSSLLAVYGLSGLPLHLGAALIAALPLAFVWRIREIAATLALATPMTSSPILREWIATVVAGAICWFSATTWTLPEESRDPG